MGLVRWSIGLLIFNALLSHDVSAQGGRDFNPELLSAVQRLLKEPGRRCHHEQGRFSKPVKYLDHAELIPPGQRQCTSCVGAVGLTILEAINTYWASASKGPNVDVAKLRASLIPREDWSSGRMFDVYGHFMQLTALNMYPFKAVDREGFASDAAYYNALRARFGTEAVARANQFQADDAGQSYSRLAMGRAIQFEELKPGDPLTFSRTLVYKGTKKSAPSQHTVIFLGYLNKSQEIVSAFSSNVVGFKYFSSQTNHGDTEEKPVKGLGERWAYFKNGFCPRRPDYFANTKVCEDQVKANGNPSAPLQVGPQMTDCCVQRTGRYRPRGARIYRPESWDYARKKEQRRLEWEAIVQMAIQHEACRDGRCQSRRSLVETARSWQAPRTELQEGALLVRAVRRQFDLVD